MFVFGSTSVFNFAVSIGLVGFMLYGPDSLISGVGAIDVASKRGALVAAGIINGMGSMGPIFQEELIGWMYRAYNQAIDCVERLVPQRAHAIGKTDRFYQ